MLEICNEECCIILDINLLVVLDVCMSGSLILNFKYFYFFYFFYFFMLLLIGYFFIVFCWINTFLFLKIEIQGLLSQTVLSLLFWSTILEMALWLPQKNSKNDSTQRTIVFRLKMDDLVKDCFS